MTFRPEDEFRPGEESPVDRRFVTEAERPVMTSAAIHDGIPKGDLLALAAGILFFGSVLWLRARPAYVPPTFGTPQFSPPPFEPPPIPYSGAAPTPRLMANPEARLHLSAGPVDVPRWQEDGRVFPVIGPVPPAPWTEPSGGTGEFGPRVVGPGSEPARPLSRAEAVEKLIIRRAVVAELLGMGGAPAESRALAEAEVDRIMAAESAANDPHTGFANLISPPGTGVLFKNRRKRMDGGVNPSAWRIRESRTDLWPDRLLEVAADELRADVEGRDPNAVSRTAFPPPPNAYEVTFVWGDHLRPTRFSRTVRVSLEDVRAGRITPAMRRAIDPYRTWLRRTAQGK